MKRETSAAPPERAARRRGYETVLIAAVSLAFLVYAGALWKNICYVAGGSDSAGYLNSARTLDRGASVQAVTELNDLQLTADYTWAFVPLGYIPGPDPFTIAPTYPPGVPLQMVAAARVGGWDRAPFFLSPLAALLCLALVYALGRELGLSVVNSLAAAAFFGLCPVLVYQAIQPMSDVIAAFWSLSAVVCCLRSRRASPVWASAAGAAFGMAVLVRPNNALLLAPILVALPPRVKHMSLFAAGGLPLAAFLFWYNAHTYGGATRTGYGSLVDGGLLAWGNFAPRLRHYVAQIFLQLSPPLPLAWAGALLAKRALSPRPRLMLFVWPIAYLLFYCFYTPYEVWWYLRFLLPALPAVIVAALLWWQEVARPFVERRTSAAAAPAVIGVALFVGVIATQAHQIWHYRVFDLDEHQYAEYVETARGAAQSLPPRAFVLSMQTSGALRYYTDLRIVRWDSLDAAKGETIIKRVAARGENLFALLFPYEVREAQRAVKGRWHKLADARGITLWRIDPPLDFGVGRDEVTRDVDELLNESEGVPAEVLSFVSPAEFERKSFYVYKFYKVALGRTPTYDEIAADSNRLAVARDGKADEMSALKRGEFADDWVRRIGHQELNPDARSNRDFVDDLERRVGVKLGDKARLVAALDDRSQTRAQALRLIVESQEVSAELYNEAYVAAMYFGFLKRAPDAEGLSDWLKVIDANPANARSMVKGFLDSVEYRRRFGGL